MNNIEKARFEYCLRLGDSSLILGHRLSEWCGHGPVLEEDIALINIALDLIGRATNILKYAGEVEGQGRTEDQLAYLRNERDFQNLLLTELPNGDFAVTIARQFFYDAYSYFLYTELLQSKDAQLAAIAEKAIKEIKYHLRHSSEWMIKLGDGTAESHDRLQTAVNNLWRYTGEMFMADEMDKLLQHEGIAPDLAAIQTNWHTMVSEVLERATLQKPAETYMQSGSKKGIHTEHLGFLLAEMQYLPRMHRGAKW
ncbi:MAG: phenylacetate-CoA oxygenase subunit PaaC [Bacteroidetes bacterium]|nr:phenylacetate-CoA oxygenase subunit PaaC [Bacteroidota bacterium]